MKFYHPERRAGQLLKLCTKNECTCAEGKMDDNFQFPQTVSCEFSGKNPNNNNKTQQRNGTLTHHYIHFNNLFPSHPENCSLQKKGHISNDVRAEKSCESTPTRKIDYGKRTYSTLILI